MSDNSPGSNESKIAEELLNRDWAGDVLSRVDKVVDGVQDKAVVPIVTIARAIVFGIIIAAMAMASTVLFSITLTRVFNNYLFEDQIWLTYTVMGGLFLIVGLLFWFRRKTKEA